LRKIQRRTLSLSSRPSECIDTILALSPSSIANRPNRPTTQLLLSTLFVYIDDAVVDRSFTRFVASI